MEYIFKVDPNISKMKSISIYNAGEEDLVLMLENDYLLNLKSGSTYMLESIFVDKIWVKNSHVHHAIMRNDHGHMVFTKNYNDDIFRDEGE